VCALESELRGPYEKLGSVESGYEGEIAAMEERYRQEEAALVERLRKVRAARGSQEERLRKERAIWESRLTTSTAFHEQQMEKERARLKAVVLEKDAELGKLESAQAVEVVELESEHRSAIERIHAETRAALAGVEEEVRRALDIDVNGVLTEVREPVFSPVIPSPRRKREESSPVGVAELNDGMERIDLDSGKMMAELERRRTEHELRIRAAWAALKEASNTPEMEKLEEPDPPLVLSPREAAPSDAAPSEKEAELLEKIALQKAAIAQLRDELERGRVVVSKRKTLLALQQKHAQTIAELREAQDHAGGRRGNVLRSVIAECSQQFAVERGKNEERVQEWIKKMDTACEARVALAKDIEKGAMGDFQKWRELRTEIGNSTISLAGKSGQQYSRKPVPRMSERVSTVFPPLHH
jgi:hypothetical protein